MWWSKDGVRRAIWREARKPPPGRCDRVCWLLRAGVVLFIVWLAANVLGLITGAR